MASQRDKIFKGFLDAANAVRETNFSVDNVDMDAYLGGELGIDSREMLEIWYEVEKRLGVEVHDYEKRNVYTIEDVVKKIEQKMAEVAEG